MKKAKTLALAPCAFAAILCAASCASASGGRRGTLIDAASNGDAALVRELVASGECIDAQDADGWTALMWAVDKGNAEIAQMLLDAGANPDAQDADGWTALMWQRQEATQKF